jgi:hypothetical protein
VGRPLCSARGLRQCFARCAPISRLPSSALASKEHKPERGSSLHATTSHTPQAATVRIEVTLEGGRGRAEVVVPAAGASTAGRGGAGPIETLLINFARDLAVATSGAATGSSGGGGGGTASSAHVPAASAADANKSAAAAAAAGARAGVPEGEATHAFYGGGLHPLLRDAKGQLVIFTGDEGAWRRMVVGGGAAGGTPRLVKLPPIGGGEAGAGDGKGAASGTAAAGAVQAAYEARAAQLRALGAVVTDAQFCPPAGNCDDLYQGPVFKVAARKHVLLPDGLVCPVFAVGGKHVILPPNHVTFKPENEAVGSHTLLADLVRQCPFYQFYLA